MSTASLVLAILSLALLGLTTFGESDLVFARLVRRAFPEDTAQRKRPERARNCFFASLPRAEKVGSEAFCVTLSERLTDRFQHGIAHFGIWSNYLFWIASWGVPRFRLIENTAHLFRYSACGLCSQIAQAFVDLATQENLTARVVALKEHVVAEAFYDGCWHVFDPDYGVIFRGPEGILSLEELAAAPEVAGAIYRTARFPLGDHRVVKMLREGDFTRLSPGVHHSPKTACLQRVLHGLKWIVPLGGLVVSAVMALCAVRP